MNLWQRLNEKIKYLTTTGDFYPRLNAIEKCPSSKMLADVNGQESSPQIVAINTTISRACVRLCNHNKQSQREVEMMPGRY